MSVPRELPADMRQAAAAMRNVFDALVAEGFTEKQALAILGHMLTNRENPSG